MKKMNEAYEYKDSKVYVVRQLYKQCDTNYRRWRCPICHEYIDDNSEVCIAFNNNKYFPNTMLHKDCFDNNDLENLLECIECEYKNMKYYEDIF